MNASTQHPVPNRQPRWLRASEDPEGLVECLALALKRRPEVENHAALPWLQHLLWLRDGLEANTLEARMLTAEEAEGLRALNRAARELGSKLKKCPRCGALSETMLTCERCGQSLVTSH